jgi:hypothetical protein
LDPLSYRVHPILLDYTSKSNRTLVLGGRGQQRWKNTVFSNEHKTERTTCLSGQVAIYVMALTPRTGSTFALIYID